ncbi:DUF159 family protein [Alicyclobacillus contaminans]|nr:DUF159 family protein [Alicyclobacillus contaminans]
MAYEGDWSAIIEYFRLTDNGFRYPPRYNIAPTQNVMAIISDGNERRAGMLRWGLIPRWSETEKTSFSTFNARAERLATAPSFRHLIARRRCVVVADGIYEWHRNTRKPYRIRVSKHEVFGMAGLWDTWRAPDGKKTIHSCTIITTEANMFMRHLHDRMPVILPRDAMDIWLDRGITDKEVAMSVLQPYDGELYAYRVTEAVGNVMYDEPECIEEVK